MIPSEKASPNEGIHERIREGFALTTAIVSWVFFLILGVTAAFLPSWGGPLMDLADMIWPGLDGPPLRSALLLSIYMAFGGFVLGGMFSALYNVLIGRSKSTNA